MYITIRWLIYIYNIFFLLSRLVCFKIFDLDRDGLLNKKELEDMVSILCTIANEAIKNQDSRSSTPSDGESEGDRGFDPELVLKNLKEKLVSVPADARKPMFQLGPADAERTVTTTEVNCSLLPYAMWCMFACPWFMWSCLTCVFYSEIQISYIYKIIF